MITSFSLFMMLRQIVQHSNSDRGWLTNTRIFLVNLFVRDSILPYGQDIHLPHHMFATVPHYRLLDLHDFLMQYPEYREEAIVVHGAVLPRHDDHPSILDVLGPDWAKQDADSLRRRFGPGRRAGRGTGGDSAGERATRPQPPNDA